MRQWRRPTPDLVLLAGDQLRQYRAHETIHITFAQIHRLAIVFAAQQAQQCPFLRKSASHRYIVARSTLSSARPPDPTPAPDSAWENGRAIT